MVLPKKNKGGAPKGNKNAVGHGRKPNEGYSDTEVIALGEELIKWLKETDDKKINVVHISEWYSEIKGIPYSQWEALKVRSCFLGYYERASAWMGKKILKNKELNVAYGSRFLGIYFKDIREHERKLMKEKVDYEFEKKSELLISSQTTPNQVIIDLQNENMSLKGELAALRDNNNKSETK